MNASTPPAIFLCLLAAGGPAMAQVRSVTLHSERAFGYLIGDEIHLEARLTVDEPFQLLDASVPRARSVTYWLDLKSVTVHEERAPPGGRSYRLQLTYQTFYSPLGPRALDIPGFTLLVGDGTQRAEARVPSWTFAMSALRDISPARLADAPLMQADIAPASISSTASRMAALAFGVGAVAMWMLLARHLTWWPFIQRAQRPFARAARQARRALAKSPHCESYISGLRAIHRAFDATAGRRVLADDVARFVQQAPPFKGLEPDIHRFFQVSRSVFFGVGAGVASNGADMGIGTGIGMAMGAEGAMAQLPPGELIAFSVRLAAAERRSA